MEREMESAGTAVRLADSDWRVIIDALRFYADGMAGLPEEEAQIVHVLGKVVEGRAAGALP